MLPRSPRNILEQDSMTEHLNAYIKYIVWFSCIFFLWLSIRKEAPWAADRSQAVNQNIEILNCHALKHCKCGHFVFSVLINIRLNISHQLGIYCIMFTCYLHNMNTINTRYNLMGAVWRGAEYGVTRPRVWRCFKRSPMCHAFHHFVTLLVIVPGFINVISRYNFSDTAAIVRG